MSEKMSVSFSCEKSKSDHFTQTEKEKGSLSNVSLCVSTIAVYFDKKNQNKGILDIQ